MPKQQYWRWCRKCQGLAFAANGIPGRCPAGGRHLHIGSWDYQLIYGSSSQTLQGDWRWCARCQGLAFVGNGGPGICPAGGNHAHTVSLDYAVAHDTSDGQSNWRWCGKCQGLAFAGNDTAGVCPAGGGHHLTGSWDYALNFSVGTFFVDGGNYAVDNQSDHTIYVKPEDGSAAVEVRPGGVYPGRHDGISAPHIRNGQVLKTSDYVGATVTNSGIETTVPGLQHFSTTEGVTGSEWLDSPPDAGWNSLFDTSNQNPEDDDSPGSDGHDSDHGHSGGVIHDAPHSDIDAVGRIA